MVRGNLVTMIFNKTLRMSTSAVSDAAAITLMSTDIERIGFGLIDMHEIYSNITEVALALWLLARLLNIATIASTVVVVSKWKYMYHSFLGQFRLTQFLTVCLIAGIPLAVVPGNAEEHGLSCRRARGCHLKGPRGNEEHQDDRPYRTHLQKSSRSSSCGN